MSTAPANETPSERRARERLAATAGLSQRLKEEEDLKKKKLMQANGDEWNTTWGDEQCSLGLHHAVLRGLEALFLHYPQIVHLGCFFWRKALIRVWTQEWGFPALPPLHGKVLAIERLRVPLHLGVMGHIKEFTSDLLPQSKKSWKPTSLGDATPLQRISKQDMSSPCLVDRFVHKEGGANVEVTWAHVGGNFLLGLVLAQQVDVLNILVEKLELDLSVADWSYGLQGSIPGWSLEDLPGGSLTGSALHIAVAANSIGGLRFATLLLQQRRQQEVGLDVVTEHTCYTPLQMAIVQDNVDMVELLLQEGGLNVNKIGSDGTALQIAARRGSVEICKMLIECPQGCDVSRTTNLSGTALHVAVNRGHQEIVALLLEQPGISASLNAVDGTDRTPMQLYMSDAIRKLLTEFVRSKK